MENKIQDKDCLQKFKQYKAENKDFLENKVVRSFLEKKENLVLLMNVLCNPSKENEDELDRAFKYFYFNIRFTSYISSALYFNAINFDKKYKKIRDRFPLTMDNLVGDENGETFKEMIKDDNSEIKIDVFLKSENIIDYLEDSLLSESVKRLTDRQKEILYLAYVKQLTDTEIGIVLHKSQQAVSKTHKKALKTINNSLKKMKGEKENGNY
ncbi:sigma-70 family RNA polymerase sigma factor [Gracilibacillus sp. S3-1-1]|uniref:Sigma-70 family RNA polymerase sigma factor n=1 Tax=Gracilibacillus pellucidus TaxID=3095368 RepID=A0ACC6M6Y3_9BACI|nr:sigma-70 family RNA polymerase sigma factor [Gracilibacillus sp. S3-1-1]MDX8046527.1 sigma-70 family RNA polymerase sigma factor [Gracilibacillus sp. S3-1-1]